MRYVSSRAKSLETTKPLADAVVLEYRFNHFDAQPRTGRYRHGAVVLDEWLRDQLVLHRVGEGFFLEEHASIRTCREGDACRRGGRASPGVGVEPHVGVLDKANDLES